MNLADRKYPAYKSAGRRRFEGFSDEEVYMLSRQAIESSANIVMLEERHYSKEQKKIHNDLMNELIEERKIRDYGTK